MHSFAPGICVTLQSSCSGPKLRDTDEEEEQINEWMNEKRCYVNIIYWADIVQNWKWIWTRGVPSRVVFLTMVLGAGGGAERGGGKDMCTKHWYFTISLVYLS